MFRRPLHVFLFLIICHTTLGSFMKHKYMVDVENGYLCPDNSQLEIPMRKYRIDRLNRTHRAITADFSLARPIDQNTEGGVILERWSDGKWMNMPIFPFQKDPCKNVMTSGFDDLVKMAVDFGKALGLKNVEKCDIPPGNYTVNNYAIDITNSAPFWAGRFRATMVLRARDTKRKIFCVGSLLNFVEI
ncbi:uncharacterized protein LOC107398080 [Tribolium castaneum]|nr:PREDICTED: uncharacterized protein LOC107398080 [Tribolium castaneum]|eukprot:XP_015836448.1 PREDICTED: uncharacterized protein LOC107398080 [Tribolium castaneum]